MRKLRCHIFFFPTDLKLNKNNETVNTDRTKEKNILCECFIAIYFRFSWFWRKYFCWLKKTTGNLPEAIVTKCQRCTAKQLQMLGEIVDWYTKNDEAKWNALVAKNLEIAKQMKIAQGGK